ncbi:MAG: hypothetical protein JWP58_3553 [Hymenobacter sp.]|nr:hypothetical protein [Hymenobacter sp.]
MTSRKSCSHWSGFFVFQRGYRPPHYKPCLASRVLTEVLSAQLGRCFGSINMWIVFALLAALASASVVTLSKAAIKDVPPSLVFAIEAVLILLVSWATVLFQDLLPDIARIERKTWLVLVVAGLLTAVSSLLVFRALSMGDASRVSPLTNISLVFSVTLAAIFLREKLTWQVMLGTALMAGGAILIATAKPSDKTASSPKDGRSESGATVYQSSSKA